MTWFKKNFLAFTLLIGFFSLPVLLFSQERLYYKGSLEVGEYSGKADYSYKIIKGDTLLDGPFLLQRSNLEALLKNEDASFLFKGAFNDDYPNGFWRFEFGEFESDNESEVVDYQYRVLVSGVQEEASGNITAGKPDGKWTYTVSRIQNSDVTEIPFKSTITFENGVPQKSFGIENENSTLVGRFLRNGLAHDEWSLYTNDDIDAAESWLFNDGVLNSIQIEENGTRQVVPMFNRTIGQTKSISLDARYLNTLEFYRRPQDSIINLKAGMPSLLAENARYYKKIDDVLSKLGKSAFLPEFKVKVPYFPLDSLGTAKTDSIRTYYRKSKAISDSLLNNSQLNILKLSDQNAGYLYSIVEKISETFLLPLGKMVEYYDADILEFIEREQLVPRLWPQGKPTVEIRPSEKGDSLQNSEPFVLANASRFNFDGNTLATINQIAHYGYLSLESIQSVLDKKLTTEQRQQELVSYEKKLISQVKQLQIRIDSLDSGMPKVNRRALVDIKKAADRQLSNYSGIKQTTEQLGRARVLVDCFARMDTLSRRVSDLPQQEEEIEVLYLDAVWNPFMANVMNEEVKKRITTAYKKVLVPYFLESISDEIDCQSVGELATQMRQTYERVVQLRDEQTSKLERKLRKELDPKEVMRLLNRPTESKDN